MRAWPLRRQLPIACWHERRSYFTSVGNTRHTCPGALQAETYPAERPQAREAQSSPAHEHNRRQAHIQDCRCDRPTLTAHYRTRPKAKRPSGKNARGGAGAGARCQKQRGRRGSGEWVDSQKSKVHSSLLSYDIVLLLSQNSQNHYKLIFTSPLSLTCLQDPVCETM